VSRQIVRQCMRSYRTHSMTQAEIAESDRLRGVVLRAGLGEIQLAAAAGCTRSTIRGWIDRRRLLAPSFQSGIRGVYSSETGGPG
jgi:hypothetical protein